MTEAADYYVYVYIDPRNYEEFYYGKGKWHRKESHLKSEGDTEKTKRIIEIHQAGLVPIIRVVARELKEDEAFLVEKTLIWKLGRTLTNVASGHFADKFRPHNEMYRELYGFDYQNGIYYFNIDEKHDRSWADCKKYGFLSAGGGKIWGRQIQSFREGDVVVAFVSGKGYVGVGIVTEKAIKANDFKIKGKSLNQLELVSKRLIESTLNPDISEYIVRVKWKAAIDTNDAKWIRNNKLFTSRMAKASLQKQRETVEYVSKAFKINVESLLKKEVIR